LFSLNKFVYCERTQCLELSFLVTQLDDRKAISVEFIGCVLQL